MFQIRQAVCWKGCSGKSTSEPHRTEWKNVCWIEVKSIQEFGPKSQQSAAKVNILLMLNYRDLFLYLHAFIYPGLHFCVIPPEKNTPTVMHLCVSDPLPFQFLHEHTCAIHRLDLEGWIRTYFFIFGKPISISKKKHNLRSVGNVQI